MIKRFTQLNHVLLHTTSSATSRLDTSRTNSIASPHQASGINSSISSSLNRTASDVAAEEVADGYLNSVLGEMVENNVRFSQARTNCDQESADRAAAAAQVMRLSKM